MLDLNLVHEFFRMISEVVMFQLFRFLILFLFCSSIEGNVVPMRRVLFEKIERGDCHPCNLNDQSCKSCELSPYGGGHPINVRYNMTRSGSRYDVMLELNGKVFNLRIDESVVSDSALPFRQCRFYRENRFKLYGVISSDSARADGGMHYFVRDKDGAFHSLGEHGHISYDESIQKREMGPIFTVSHVGEELCYELKDNKFTSKENCLEKGDGK